MDQPDNLLKAVDPDAPIPRGAWISLTLLLLINLFNYVDRQMVPSLLPFISKTLFHGSSLSEAKVNALMGTLGTAFFVSYMITAPIFGFLSDRYSRWILIGISVLAWSLATGGSGLAGTFTIMLAMRLCVGVGEGGYGPSAPTIISDLFPLKRRGLVMACFYMAIPVGSALGYVIGPMIEKNHGWRAAFLFVTPPGILLGLLCFFQKEPARGLADRISLHEPAKKIKKAGLAEYLALLKNPTYVFDCLGMIAMTFAIGGISYWIPDYLIKIRHVGTAQHVGIYFGGIVAVAGVVATLAGGLISDWLQPRLPTSYLLLSGIGLLLSCPFILLMVHSPFPRAWVYLFIASFFLFFNTGPTNTVLANVTSPAVRGSAFALCILLIHGLGDVPSPPILGGIGGKFGWNVAFGVVAAATALGGIFWLIGCKYIVRDTEKALEESVGG